MSTRIEFRWDENSAYAGGDQWTVYVSDQKSGSSTSFGARTWDQGIRDAFWWLGIDIEIWVRH